MSAAISRETRHVIQHLSSPHNADVRRVARHLEAIRNHALTVVQRAARAWVRRATRPSRTPIATLQQLERSSQAPAKVVEQGYREVVRLVEGLERDLGRGAGRSDSGRLQRVLDLVVALETYVQGALLATTPDAEGYRRFSGRAFVRGEGDEGQEWGIHPSDVRQGYLNDCYLFAAMAAVAQTDPRVIKEMIQDHGNGLYTVTFRGMGRGGGDAHVTVNDRFPFWQRGGRARPTYGKVGDKVTENGATVLELWPMLIEKAYAQLKGGFANIERNRPSVPMRFMSGQRVVDYELYQARNSAARIGEILSEAARKKYPTALVTHLDESRVDHATLDEMHRLDVHSNHAYTFTGLSGGRVRLRNPWGHEHPQPLSFEQVKRFCFRMSVGYF